MSYECCGRGSEAAAGDSFTASLKALLRLLRFIYDYATDSALHVDDSDAVVAENVKNEVSYRISNVISIILDVALIIFVALTIIITIISLSFRRYRSVIATRFKTSLSTIRCRYGLSVVRGWKSTVRLLSSKKEEKVQRVAPTSLGTSTRTYYRATTAVADNNNDGRRDACDDVSSSASGAAAVVANATTANPVAAGYASQAGSVRRVKLRIQSDIQSQGPVSETRSE